MVSTWKAKQASSVNSVAQQLSFALLCGGICCQLWLWVAAAASRALCSTLCHGNAPSSPDSQPPFSDPINATLPTKCSKNSTLDLTNCSKICCCCCYQSIIKVLPVKWPNVSIEVTKLSKWPKITLKVAARCSPAHLVKYCDREPISRLTDKSFCPTLLQPTPTNHHRTQKKAEIKSFCNEEIFSEAKKLLSDQKDIRDWSPEDSWRCFSILLSRILIICRWDQ